VLRQAAYATLGVVLGILVNLFGFWAGTSSRWSQEVLGPRMATRTVTTNLQSTALSIGIIVVLALACAFAVGTVAKKKLA